jgi:hypothetical protein
MSFAGATLASARSCGQGGGERAVANQEAMKGAAMFLILRFLPNTLARNKIPFVRTA